MIFRKAGGNKTSCKKSREEELNGISSDIYVLRADKTGARFQERIYVTEAWLVENDAHFHKGVNNATDYYWIEGEWGQTN